MNLGIVGGVEPPPHYLRHDYESVFWVALWLMTRPEPNGSRAPTDSEVPKRRDLSRRKRLALLKKWESGTLDVLSSRKWAIITNQTMFVQHIPTPAMRHYEEWISEFWQVLRTAYNACSNTKQDGARRKLTNVFNPPKPRVLQQNIETLGDSITLEKIQEGLRIWEEQHAQGITGFVPFFTANRIEH